MSSSWGSQGTRVVSEEEFMSWMAAAESRTLETPSIYEIEAFLVKLTPRYKVEVWWIRHYMKWFFKRCYKQWGIAMQNPYWMPPNTRR